VGVDMKSFRRNQEVGKGFYIEVPIAIKIEGTYHNIARFFDLMAKLPRIVNMGALNVGIAREDVHSTRLSVSGTATTFRFAEG
jgi:type IV pilus assembly protein PilO